jgi:hypothetical protein
VPFTLEIIMCLTLNSALECAGSIFQVTMGFAVVVIAVLSLRGWVDERTEG